MDGCTCIGQLDEDGTPVPVLALAQPPAPLPPLSLGTVLFVSVVVATAIYLYVKD